MALAAAELSGTVPRPLLLAYWSGMACRWIGVWFTLAIFAAILTPWFFIPFDVRGRVTALFTWVEWVIFSLPIFWLTRRWLISPSNWMRTGLVHAAWALLFAILHVTIFTAVRHGVFDLPYPAQLTSTEFVLLRLPRHIVFAATMYAAIAASATSVHYLASAERRALQQALAAEETSRISFDAARTGIQPSLLLPAMERTADLLSKNPARAEESILRMADLLRFLLRLRGEVWSAADEVNLAAAFAAVYGTVHGEAGRIEVTLENGEDASLPRLSVVDLTQAFLKSPGIRHAEARVFAAGLKPRVVLHCRPPLGTTAAASLREVAGTRGVMLEFHPEEGALG